MQTRLDPCSRALAAQDFCHASQRDSESVLDFIRWLEQLFKPTSGGLHYEVMKAAAVSGSHTYKELCLSARNEER